MNTYTKTRQRRTRSGRPHSSRPRNFSKRNKSQMQTADIHRFIQDASKENRPEVKEYETKHSFADFNFCAPLQANLSSMKFTTPTPIQDQSIKSIMEGRDVIGLANTGTGKTGAFLLPMIHKMRADKRQQLLVVAPTRELALQIDNALRDFAKGLGINSAACIGGTPLHKQIHNLKRRPQVVIGTPGRLKDLVDRKVLNLSFFNNVVIDEVDRMMDMGFINDITMLLKQTPANRQTLFFSATMPPTIKQLTLTFSKDPIVVEIQSGRGTINVTHDVISTNVGENKILVLCNILKKPECKRAIVFSETKRGVERLCRDLSEKGIRADSIHGDKRQGQRQRSLERFKRGNVDVLVATDVAARGLDINDVSHVINFTLPQSLDDYIHRIGRAGRANKKGTAITFI